MKRTSVNKHPADIAARIAKRGGTLASVARDQGVSSSSISKALRTPCLAGEEAIAAYLGTHPKELWPSRYDVEGNPRHARSHLKTNVANTTLASQKSVSA